MFFYTFLPKLLNMSLTAGVAVLFVLLLRLLLRRTPKAISYALWAVVLFRLLCPVAPVSALSLYNLFDAPAAQTGGRASSIEYVPEDIVHTEFPEVALPVPGISESVNETLPQGEEQLRADPLEAPMAIATFVWMAGAAAMALYSAVSYIRLKRSLLSSAPLRDNIYLADDIASPFVLGLLRPKVYLPSSLAEREQDYIILHEQHHIRRFDHIIKALSFFALCLHWFNPLVWLAFVLSGRDMEMSCDEAVIRKLGADVRADYSASLLSLATGKRVIAGMPLAFGEGDAKGRIRNLANWKKPAFWVVLVAVLACVALTVGLLTNPAAEESGANGAGYYLRIGAEGVMEIGVSTPNTSGGVIHADGSAFEMGEEVWLETLDGVTDLRGVSITAMDKDGEILYALSVPEGATDEEVADIVGGDGWLLAPAGTLGADPLHYKSAAAAAAAVEEMTAIYCPDAQSGSDNVIQIGAASGPELAKYLQQWDWKPCAPPRHALPSPGSVEFVIAEDYRVSVHQRKEGSLRRYGEVEYRGERRYYSIGRSDYPDAVALVYARNEAAAAAPAVQEWFNYLDSPADMPWGESLEIEIPAFPDLTFRYYPEWIEAGNKSAVKTILTGMPIWNAYFADLSGDGMPEICATATFGSGVIDSRILVYDYVAGESYVLEDRGEYDYALTLHNGRLLAVQSVYMGESIASGELRLVQRADGTKELRAELRPMEGAATVSPDIVRGVDLDHDGSTESIGLEQIRYGGELYELHVRREDGSLLWSEELAIPHAGWNTLLLYESGGRDYLIRYKPTMYQGEGTYSCTQFHFANGRENVVHRWETDFSLPVDMSESMKRFENEVNAILENSILLATTEQLELVVGPVAATEVPQIYPVRFDPDEITAAMNEAEEGPNAITPEAAAARHIEMERLFENAAPWRKGSRRVGGDWDGDGREDSVGFRDAKRREFTVELSGSGTQSIRRIDTGMWNNGLVTEDSPWGWEYYFDTGDVNADGADELLFAIDTGAQGGAGAFCLLVCPTDGRGIEAFTQIEDGLDYRLYWEGGTDSVRIECADTGYQERIEDSALILPYMGTPEEAASRIEWHAWTEGRARGLIEYIRENLAHTDEAELWSIWMGLAEPPIVRTKTLRLCELRPEHIKALEEEREICAGMAGCEIPVQHRIVIKAV